MECHICEAKTSLFSRATVLHKYDVEYFCCPDCGFVQTETPYWLDEAYSTAITNTDIGPVNRMMVASMKTSAILLAFFDVKGRFLDYGGGYGLFVRRMRDIGFDFHYYDKYCANLFASGFEVAEAELLSAQYDLATAFEVVEHMPNPLAGMREVMRFSNSVFFSTEVLPANTPKPGEWWYYSPEHGQHISFFSGRSLYRLANRLGRRLYSFGSLHLITDKKINTRLFEFILKDPVTPPFAYVLGKYRKISSLLQDDWQRLLQANK